jgi:foldase protein PrsA
MARPAKKPTKKTTPAVSVKSNRIASFKQKIPAFNFPKVILVLSIFLGALILYVLRDKYMIATVNGSPITRIALLNELESIKGAEVKEVVNNMIDKTLIFEEADKRNISVTDAEIDAEIKKIEDNVKQYGQTLDAQLQAYGLTREALRENLRIQKLVEKMMGGNVTATDAEIDAYLAENERVIPEEQKENVEQLRLSAKQQLESQKLEQKYQEFMQSLRENGDIKYFRNY